MPVTKRKQAEKTQTVTEIKQRIEESLTESTETLIDLHGELSAQITTIEEEISEKVKLDRQKISDLRGHQAKLEARIVAAMEEGLKPTEGKKIFGKLYEAALGKKKSQTSITDRNGIFKILGLKRVKLIASFTLGDLRAYMTPEELKQVTETTEDGPRSFKISRRKKE